MKKHLLLLTFIVTVAVTITACNTTVNINKNEEQTGIANPWHDCTEEEAYQLGPNGFSAPEGATNVHWSICDAADEKSLPGPMVQLDFDYEGLSFTAREQAVPGEEITDISGMYYDWTVTEDDTLNNWAGGNMPCRLYRYAGDGEYADLCLWFDIETGYAYSLSTTAPDLDGFDIKAVAEAIYDPAKQIGANAPDEPEEGSTEETETSSSLPPYVYSGEDPVYEAAYQYMIDEYAGQYTKGDVSIPCSDIIAEDRSDKDDIKLWGNFWIFNYDLSGSILECVSGGSYPGLIHLKETADGYEVTGMDVTEDGSGYEKSAKEIFGKYYEDLIKADADTQGREKMRAQIISDYAAANGLLITAYQDYGWDPVSILPDDMTSKIDISGCDTFTQIVDRLSPGNAYTNTTLGDTDVLLVSLGSYDDTEGHYNCIDADIYCYVDGVPKYLGSVSSGSTAYPVAVGDGYLYVGSHHYIEKYTVKNNKLVLSENASEIFDEDGNSTYYCSSADGSGTDDADQDVAAAVLDRLNNEMFEASILNFDVIR